MQGYNTDIEIINSTKLTLITTKSSLFPFKIMIKREIFTKFSKIDGKSPKTLRISPRAWNGGR